MKKYIIIFWTLVFTGILSVFLVFFLAEQGYLGKMPTIQDLENPKSNLASVIYSSDGQELGSYFYQNRTNAKYKDMSPYLVNALIATEDERFRSHPGIDVRGTVRAMVYLGANGGASTITQQLAKMLFTEQKSANKIRRVVQKLKEWIIASKLERYYTKNEIVAMYFNRFDFVNNAVGINSAAKVYFNCKPDSLEIHEAAMLVGMAKNPSLFNPIRRPDTTLQRRNVVLGQMVRNKFITQLEFDSISQLPLGIDYQSVDHNDGVAPYFRETLRAKVTDILNTRVKDSDEYLYAKPDGERYDVYRDGLKIYATINYKMQKYAENAVATYLGEYLQKEFSSQLLKRKNFPFASLSDDQVESVLSTARKRSERYRILTGKECSNCHRRGDFIQEENIEGVDYWVCQADDCEKTSRKIDQDSVELVFDIPVEMKVFSWRGEIDTTLTPNDSIRYYKSFLQAGLMSLDPANGHIKAWVGGIDHEHFAFDHVQLAKRQVGSTFKPFVYGLALEAGLSACHMVPDIKHGFKRGEFGLLQDWAPSNGEAFSGVEVSLKYGLANSMNNITAWVMKRFTPQAAVQYAHKCGIESFIDPVPALCLGVADISLFEMVTAYSTFANKGIRMEPTYLLRIEDNGGNVIYEAGQEITEVMSPENAYKVIDLMRGVTEGERGGPENKKTGTAIRLRYDSPTRGYDGVPSNVQIAGKTGTTQGNSDGWFMGIVPELVTGVWVGADDRSVRFLNTSWGQGANTALPIWGYYMKSVWGDKSLKIDQDKPFEKPESLKNYNFECDKAGSEQDPFGVTIPDCPECIYD
ncbi:MAG: transglycosylase domain-containing protein [Salibacteraceae bacterium]|nr:transglycosylase domain-containing protein [Salibacteraceae bacterium]